VKEKVAEASGTPLTPLSAYCYGHAFAKMVAEISTNARNSRNVSSIYGVGSFNDMLGGSEDMNLGSVGFLDLTGGADVSGMGMEEDLEPITICVGRDPRVHGVTLADAMCRGIESVKGVKAVYTGLASTPSMFEFCRTGTINDHKIDGSVMVTASHLPEDRNGFKFYTKKNGGLTGTDIDKLTDTATSNLREWFDVGIMPPTSGVGGEAVYCSSWVNFMPHYVSGLRDTIIMEASSTSTAPSEKPLSGLRIVLNAGNGSGYIFNEILKDLGADVSHSINLTPDGTFSKDFGVPNPESKAMIKATTKVCEEAKADIGIMLDTDADRCGFVVCRNSKNTGSSTATYEALNRNRLIALLSVILKSSSPGCTVVTDSVTSEGLSKFLTEDLGLDHVRYLKGYANVIGKAKEITESGEAIAEMAIETSGHCAMRENGYLDDGTYTAAKVIGLLARVAKDNEESSDSVGHVGLLDLISDLVEMQEVEELRLSVVDGTILSTERIFNDLANEIMMGASSKEGWEVDLENLEGVRVRNGADGSFFMLRKSLHDPVISLQVEGSSVDNVRASVILPLLDIIKSVGLSSSLLDTSALSKYASE